MPRKILLYCVFLLAATALLSACATQKKGCGCGSNLNYYKPRKFNK